MHLSLLHPLPPSSKHLTLHPVSSLLMAQNKLNSFLKDFPRGWNTKIWKEHFASLVELPNSLYLHERPFLEDVLALWTSYLLFRYLIYAIKLTPSGLIHISWEWIQLNFTPLGLPLHRQNPAQSLSKHKTQSLRCETTDHLLRFSQTQNPIRSVRKEEWCSMSPQMKIRNGFIGVW